MTMDRSIGVRACGAAALALASGWAHAADLNVPAQFPTIQAAINAASAGDTILVAPGTYAERIDFLGKPITVRSTGGAAATTINGGGVGPVVRFVSGETSLARLEGFTITGGVVVNSSGGGVRIVNASPVITDSIITANRANTSCTGCVGRGGGLAIDGGSPELTRVRFASNLTFSLGLGRPGGGAVFIASGSPAFTDCTFISNRSINWPGGAVLVGPGASASFAGGFFQTNDAESSSGGAIHLDRSALTLTDVSFTGNFAEFGSGGAIEAANPISVTVTRCTFTANDSRKGGGPGAISINGGSIEVSDSTFTANRADGGSGGAIGAILTGLTVRSSTFISNEGFGGAGGGISAEQSTVLVEDSVFTANSSGLGGGLYSEDSSLTVRRSTFTANNAGGGGVAARGGSFTIENSSFTGNTGQGASGGALRTENTNATVLSSRFSGNRVTSASGGAASFNGGSFTVRDSAFNNNAAPGGLGGALAFAGSASGSVDRSTFNANGIITGGGPGGAGGALAADGAASVLLVNALLTANSGTGGALRVSRNASLTVANSTLVDNTPEEGQSTALVTSSAAGQPATLRIVNSILRGSLADGRLMLARSGTNTLLDATFSNIQGGSAGAGNIDADPLFINPASGNYRLGPGSPSLDAGSNAGVPAGITLDLAGNARIVGQAVDMGAYEAQGACPGSGPGACGPGDWNEDGAIDFNDLLAFLNDYNAQTPCSDTNADGAVDFNDLLEFLNRYNTSC